MKVEIVEKVDIIDVLLKTVASLSFWEAPMESKGYLGKKKKGNSR